MDYGTHQTRSPDRPFSLFEGMIFIILQLFSINNMYIILGLAGTIYFLIDMQNPSSAKFPGYTL